MPTRTTILAYWGERKEGREGGREGGRERKVRGMLLGVPSASIRKL